MTPRKASASTSAEWHRDLSVVLHDLAWLLPRTVGAAAALDEPLPASELEVMRLLTRRPGLSVNEIAERLSLRPSNASTAVRALEGRGLVRRTPDERDRRVVRVAPTPASQESRARREEAWGRAMADVAADLEPGQRARLRDALPALRALTATLAGHER